VKIDLGIAHNEILDNFFSKNNDETIYSLSHQEKLKEAFIIIDEYLISIGSEVTFSEMYYDNPEFQSSLNKIFEAGTNIHEIKNIITEENNDYENYNHLFLFSK